MSVRHFQLSVARALSAAGIRDEDAVVVGCSHGPDSLALADALLTLRDPATVTLVYVDHGLRAEAAEEGRAVSAFAQVRGARARVVPVRVEPNGRGLEDAARAARLAALEDARREAGARWIALAHTASDQAETVVQRLLRGAGVVGLAGIPPVRGAIVRPLLGVPRADVLAYLAERGLSPSHDAMNDDPRFLRTRVRHAHLPALRAENPRLDEALGRTAEACRELADALDWAADQALARVGRGEGRLDAAGLAGLPPAVAKRLLLRLHPALEGRHLDAVLALAARPTAGSLAIDLPGLRLVREYGDLVLARPAAPEASLTPLVVEGDDGPYLVRLWQPGDRMRPASLRGRSRKLQDLFTDRKVPRDQRRTARVVVRERDHEIVWAEHVGSATGSRLRVI